MARKPVTRPSTVILRPSQSGTLPRPASAVTSLRKKIERKCEECHAPLDLQSIAQSCQIVDDKVVCPRCVRKNAVARKLRVYYRATLTILILTCIAVSVLLPQVMLLVLLPFGALSILAGILATSLSSTARLGFLAGGLAAIVGGFAGTQFMKQRAETAKARQVLQLQSEEVHTLLNDNRYVDAQNKIQAIESAARTPSGVITPETQTKIAELKASADGWLRPRYGELNDQEKTILNGLMTSFPDSPGSNRFRTLKMQDYRLSIAVTAQAEEKIDARAGGPPSNPLERQARVMGLLLFTNYPILRHIDVELFDAENKSLGNFAFDREQLANMRMGAISEPPR